MPPPPSDQPLLELSLTELQRRIQDFLREYLKNKSPETVGTYRRSLHEFERWFALQKRHGGFRFTVDGVKAYKKYLMQTRGLHQVSVSTYLTALRRFCQYLVDIGLLAENPARSVKGNRRPTTHSRSVLTKTEIDALLEAVDTTTRLGKRDRAIIYMMLFAGLSEIEIVRADVQDLEQTLLGWFLRVQGKGHTIKDQQVPIDPPVMDAIRLYLDARGRIRPEDPLFVSHGRRSEGQRLNTRSVRSRINGYLKTAGVKRRGVTPHSLTHTAALIWLNDGMSLEEVRRRMRHGTLETTMIYFKKQGLLTRDPDELREIEG
ncbi:site-specific integrase [Rhodocaloribacter litoris]|uniref:tyrosine-type recombinase/integrase n=1 Tax=Rhodocaloribacter litoris TaxID=2558931 RepID=UPI00141EA089|nr:tyrosine-type recombinase/integrase [Rhodocaloribacter litoris]QXD14262.1 site-specific integrase [Rhodocaloribacter litoris]GIV60657.1 MAG: integrase [Rhodothermaceae bacterium]